MGRDPICEHRFDNRPKNSELGLPRKWRFDFAYPDLMIALEVEGATWVGGRHSRGSGFAKDCEKYNEAIKQGWKVYRVTAQMLTMDYLKSILPV
jgi:hypothetical protein